MAGRAKGFRHNETTRQKIKAAQIINRLQDHILAPEPIMDPSQVNAAKVLLSKILPDLKAVDLSGTVETTITIDGSARKL